MEGEGLGENAPRGEGNAHHLQVALQQPILARRAVIGDKCRLKLHVPLGELQPKAVLIHIVHTAISLGISPACPLHIHHVRLVQPALAQPVHHLPGRQQRDLPLPRCATAQHRDVSLHNPFGSIGRKGTKDTPQCSSKSIYLPVRPLQKSRMRPIFYREDFPSCV